MNELFKFILICLPPAIIAPVAWLLLRLSTGSTKYAWALAIAIGYAAGHISLASWLMVPDGPWSAQLGDWARHVPAAFQSIAWPGTTIDWLPIGVLLAGLVSVNAAALPLPGVTFVGAALISIWLAVQLVGGSTVVQGDWYTANVGIRLGVGMLTLLACWLSVQRSIEGRSQWVWIGVMFIMTIAVAAILALSGNTTFAILCGVVFFAMLGSLLVSLPNCGTEDVRFAGASIAVVSISLLLAGWMFANLSWYPIPLITLGFFAINMWLPSFAGEIAGRVGISFCCAVAAVAVTVYVP